MDQQGGNAADTMPLESAAHPPLASLARLFGRVGAWRRQGDAARDRRDWPAAAAAYARSLALDPRQAPIWVQYGHVLKEGGRPDEALGAYRRATRLRPADADAWLHVGHTFRLLNRLDEAESACREAARLAPADPRAAGELDAIGHLRQEAVAAAQAAARLEAASQARAAMAEAAALEAAGRDASAAAVLFHALRQVPGHGEALDHYRVLRRRINAASRQGFLAARPAADLPAALHFAAFGTTGLCNASCIHCPTGKPETAHVPRVPMPMPLFRRILTQMAELDLKVHGQMSFGLFGDGLVDPHVVERAWLVRELLPDTYLSVNTNGAAYSRERHRALFDLCGIMALHVESLVPAVYDRLMARLRLDRVLPKIIQILEDFPGKVHVSIPASRLNRAELPALHEWFMARGAVAVCFDGLSSRCAEDRSLFDSLALNPTLGACGPDALDQLIVDCDGEVLTCCFDFQRIDSIGRLSLAQGHLADTLLNEARRRVREQFAQGRHQERQTCSRCYNDARLDPAEVLAPARA